MECMGRLVMHDGLTYREPPAIALSKSSSVIQRENLDFLDLGVQDEFLNDNYNI